MLQQQEYGFFPPWSQLGNGVGAWWHRPVHLMLRPAAIQQDPIPFSPTCVDTLRTPSGRPEGVAAKVTPTPSHPTYTHTEHVAHCAAATGLIYRDITELEHLTTKSSSRKPILSIHVLLRQKRCTLQTWATSHLHPKLKHHGCVTMQRMPHSHVKLMREWYRDTVAAMGIQEAGSPLSS